MHAVLKALVGLAAIGASHAHPHDPNCSTSSTLRPISTPAADPQLFHDVLSAPTAIERFQRLLVEGEVLQTGDTLRNLAVFDFNGAQSANGTMDGATESADIETYPFSTDLNVSMTVGFLESCGINTSHIDPRATELPILVEGFNLRFGSILENGLVKSGGNQEISGTLGRLQMTAFPQGNMHWQFNGACEKSVFVAALNSGNPGTNQMVNSFTLNTGIVNATLGSPGNNNGTYFDQFKKSISASLAQDVNTCLARCKRSQ